MSRFVLAAVAAACLFSANAALLPDYFYKQAKAGSHEVPPKDAALFEEYGFDQSEQASYGKLTVTSWRFRDTTGAIAGFQYLRQPDAKPCDFAKIAVCAPSYALVALGNYVLEFQGAVPKGEEVNLFLYHAPKWEQSPLPTITGFLPPEGLVPNSERYILGPISLERFGTGIPPSAVAFHLSAEGEYARYRGTGGDMDLLMFAYPTPTMARDQSEVFRNISGSIVKRTGPLVALVRNSKSADDAERLLSRVNYEATVTINEIPAHNQAVGWARALLSMFALAGIILLFCIASGLLFGGFRVLSRRWRHGEDDDAMITLHLEGK